MSLYHALHWCDQERLLVGPPLGVLLGATVSVVNCTSPLNMCAAVHRHRPAKDIVAVHTSFCDLEGAHVHVRG